MSLPLSRRWKARDAYTFHWHQWGEDTVIFNVGSGDTHKLDPIAVEALKILQQQPASPQELITILSSNFDIEQSDEIYGYIEHFLTDLDKLGLIEQLKQ